ncbi:MAG: bifunctional demethylmenaquinone methyltransferase/2-methoxy-6-polyprenyl-1,4-benzoquinol methylase UbiE [Prevotellaceae bacterium]|jgi:demethylmenaquinone methyltransferase/2-methoxy-6-polyprenyl-1,4-benzoquinol methylase|nr:bifunctional demethylmenaquinone methyltransferase/2-methoxy-6-polyprenyl-1,4-benzoquinol methylase UbiE [Prevotellaceae bacterium]
MANKKYVSKMFDDIADKYDFMNHVLSFGIDKFWRKRLVKELRRYKPKKILDIATGTGDSAIVLLQTDAEKIIGVDISKKMLARGKEKIRKKKLSGKIELIHCDGESLKFKNNTFDAVNVSFGVRNFENLDKGLSEIYQAVKPDGIATILEFSMPGNFMIRQIYSIYFFYILPLIGRFFSQNRYAYSYLPQSVKTFPKGKQFVQRLQNAGFRQTRHIPLTFGIAEIYIGIK